MLEKLYFMTILDCISDLDSAESIISTCQRPRVVVAEKPHADGTA